MKVSVCFKTPDAVDCAIEDALEYNEELEAIADDEERAERRDEMESELREFLEQWIQYGELVVIAFDTEKNTAEVKRG